MNLVHHFLIAMPQLDDPQFHRSVIYICEHNQDGAMGLIVNVPIDLSIGDMLKEIEISPSDTLTCPINLDKAVLNGGPLADDRGFILHPPHKLYNSTLKVNEDVFLTSSKDILSDLGTDLGPQKFLVTLGYAGWSAGQLEQELGDNMWLTIPADANLLFSTPISERWNKAMHNLGFNPANLSTEVGHA